jgi:hypothetical protein
VGRHASSTIRWQVPVSEASCGHAPRPSRSPERPWCAPARRGRFPFQQHPATGSMRAGARRNSRLARWRPCPLRKRLTIPCSPCRPVELAGHAYCSHPRRRHRPPTPNACRFPRRGDARIGLVLFSLGHGRYRLLAVRLTMEVIGPTASGMKTRPPEPHRRRALLDRVGRS